MSDNSKIEWTDATWNPVTGCTKVSPGCDQLLRTRRIARPVRRHGGLTSSVDSTCNCGRSKLDQPLAVEEARVACSSTRMSDLFHADIPDDYIAKRVCRHGAARTTTRSRC
jgi:protein gp37